MFPFEALHTLPLGPAKHLLREEMPLLSKGQKAEILARLKAFHTSGFSVKLYGNACLLLLSVFLRERLQSMGTNGSLYHRTIFK